MPIPSRPVLTVAKTETISDPARFRRFDPWRIPR